MSVCNRQKTIALHNRFKCITAQALVREYQTPNGANVREVGSIAYGYSITIGPGGKPHVKEFGNVNAGKEMHLGMAKPSILVERKPLHDITATDKGLNAVMQIPGIRKDIKINIYD